MLTINKKYAFEKTGVDEIEGLAAVLEAALQPVLENINDRAYLSKATIDATEYKSRDGFIPHGHNCGGRAIQLVVMKCEEYGWDFLPFGECDDDKCNCRDDMGNGECPYDVDGFLDANLRVWLKFEGIDDKGEMSFYLYMGGGNGDAPYFRSKDEATLFERSFTAKSLAGVKRQAGAAVKALLKVMS